jgi:hypothetical protein
VKISVVSPKFYGGVAVGILAVTGVFAMEEDDKPRSVEHSEEGLEEQEDDIEEKPNGDEALIVRAS